MLDAAAMVTRNGWLVAGVAVTAAVTGRLFGATELYVLAAIAAALLVVAAATTAMARLNLDIGREIHPVRVHAGSPSRVDLRVENRGGHRSPVVGLHDSVSSTRGAHLTVGPLPPGGIVRAAYRLPTERRGVLTIGPLEVTLADPFGLTRVAMRATDATELTVYPHVDALTAVPQTTGNDPMAGAEHPNALGRNGEDFYALRRYVVGDDLRRVHWPATARHDELMVRQDELPWQGRTTVLVDVRAATTTPENLERAISAAASLVVASSRRNDLIRLVATDGFDSQMAAGHAHVEAVLEHLAATEPAPDAYFTQVVRRLALTDGGGALVAVVGDLRPDELDLLLGLGNRFGSVRVVRFADAPPTEHVLPRGRARRAVVLDIAPAESFAQEWTRSTAPRRRRDARPPLAPSPHEAQPDSDRWTERARLRS